MNVTDDGCVTGYWLVSVSGVCLVGVMHLLGYDQIISLSLRDGRWL